MAGKELKHKAATITAVGGGWITLASVAGFYKNAIVWLNDSGATAANNKRAIITEVDTTLNKLRICLRSIEAGAVPTYGASDMSAYNGGTVTQHDQFVYNSDDLGLT